MADGIARYIVVGWVLGIAMFAASIIIAVWVVREIGFGNYAIALATGVLSNWAFYSVRLGYKLAAEHKQRMV